MSFEVAVKNAQVAQATESQTPTSAPQTSKERALAAFMRPTTASQAQAQELPVRNATNISPEEFSAVSPSYNASESDAGQNGLSESASSPVESPKADTKATPDEPLSNQYALLARKEKALRAKAMQQDQAIKAREAGIVAREEAIKAKDAEYQSKYIARDRISQDPISVLNDLGLSYDQITQLMLNAPKAEDMARAKELQSVRDELNAVKEQQVKSQKAYDDAQTQSYQQAINQIRLETKSLVNSDPTFETIKATDSVSDVVELIEETFKKDGILLTVEEAATEVENYLVEEAMKLARLNKIQQRLKPAVSQAAAKPSVATQKLQAESKPPIKTLTNSVGISRPLSARDRAILAFKGEKA